VRNDTGKDTDTDTQTQTHRHTHRHRHPDNRVIGSRATALGDDDFGYCISRV